MRVAWKERRLAAGRVPASDAARAAEGDTA
jgi:hypothetical protein